MPTAAALEEFAVRGVTTVKAAVTDKAVAVLVADLEAESESGRPGRRLDTATAAGLLGPTGPLGGIAAALLGSGARPVRVLLFDKSSACNWAVPWHQDRTIAVAPPNAAARNAPGFGPWSTKHGAPHVEPPFDVLAGMASLRLHLDPCDADNGPLVVAPGSHRLGRIASEHAAAIAESLGPETCLADAGDLLALSTPILHASPRASRPRRRRVLHVDFAAHRLPGGLEWAAA